MLAITETDIQDWKYVSEGGATIVFSYTPKSNSNPRFEGTVLRLRKAIVPRLPHVVRPKDDNPTILVDEPDDPMIEYQTKCMTRLIPPSHLPRLETVRLDRSWLQQFNTYHEHKRPEARREKDSIDLSRTKGVLATDLVGGDWLAVEIKPKWAFLPNPSHLSPQTHPIKTQTCRFCMHSHMRSESGKMVALGYCPLDLFSGDEERVSKAVDGLWKSWADSNGTVNNLKIFSRGKVVRPAEAHLMIAGGVDPLQYPEGLRDIFRAALVRPLLQTPVLHILSKLQRTLDLLDIEGLAKLWRRTEASAPLYRTTFASFFEESSTEDPPSTPLGVSSLFLSSPEPNIADWTDFLDTYLSPASANLNNSAPAPENLRYYLLAYLLSATFKDCSIIIRLGFLGDDTQSDIVKPDSVRVIDLDPKSMDKLRGWEKLDTEIVTAYAKKLDPKVCIDTI
ncbi:inositol-pentakisphosphate 2-kinase [Crucibulum laeve]|uniref:Inositol-pentakisphosphate 2-kinase n=1 Tax=Crucibulum laeve TaxID=68775 RepID=A0A5C3MCS8_9AGAR|nr:inositol-pentakisphosphate 2-kinase [Crucibulum laeve]